MVRHAIVCGGSIGGLFAAAALRQAGWDVDVFERTDLELSGRGAGIVTHDALISALRAVGSDISDLGVQVEERVAFDLSGRIVARLAYPQVVTSWDHIHQKLRNLIPSEHYHLGRNVVGFSQETSRASAHFADGGTADCDLLVGADGFRSAIRAQMLPDVTPQYAGYVVWRTLAHEADLPGHIRDEIFPKFSFFAPSGSQIIGYPIAGKDNDLRPGHRRYNFVWYAKAPDLKDMLTDGSGQFHPISIPPPLVRDDVLARMRETAEATLPRTFVDILDASERPFFTPIYDHHSPSMHDGRVVLAGDAACGARPHVGMGVTKAAEDALSLARHASGSLDKYSAERVAASLSVHLRGRLLGDWVFEEDPANSDGASNRRLAEIMSLTAVTVDQAAK